MNEKGWAAIFGMLASALVFAEAFGSYDTGWQWGTPAWEGAFAVSSDGRVAGWTAGSLFASGSGVDAFVVQPPARGWQTQWSGNERAYALLESGNGLYWAGTVGEKAKDAMRAQTDALLVRMDAEGRVVWRARLGGKLKDEARALAPAADGGVYVAGRGEGRIFGPGFGNGDVFLARYSADGKRLWGVQWGSDDDDYVTALAADPEGGVWLAGYSDIDEDCRRISERGFLLRFSPSGQVLLEHRWGFDSATRPETLVVQDGGVWVFGETDGVLYGKFAGGWDVFAVFVDPQGTPHKGVQWGGAGVERVHAALLDDSGFPFWLAGSSSSDHLGAQQDHYDALVVLLGDDATPAWIWQEGTPANDEARALAIGSTEGPLILYVAGLTYGSFFAPNAGQADAWAARLCFDPVFGMRKQPSACER